jgi:hypothetical protein
MRILLVSLDSIALLRRTWNLSGEHPPQNNASVLFCKIPLQRQAVIKNRRQKCRFLAPRDLDTGTGLNQGLGLRHSAAIMVKTSGDPDADPDPQPHSHAIPRNARSGRG